MTPGQLFNDAWVTGDRDGATYDTGLDGTRLNRQAADVFAVMRDGRWHTLTDVATTTGHPEASVSARLRDLRKPRFGCHLIERRRAAGGGLNEYRWAGPTPPTGSIELGP